MKKIISVLLLTALLALALVGCGYKDNGGKEETFTLSIAVDSAFSGVKTSNTVVALVTDSAGKIVACRFDCAESSLTASEGELVTNPAVTTKVELGDAYSGMPAGSWANQTKAFENLVVGKTAAEVAALDTSAVGSDNPIVAGCTMSNTVPVFQSLIAKAFAYERKVSFSTNKAITLGVSIAQSLSGAVADESATVAADYAAAVLVDGKVVAGIIDSNERSFTISYNANDEAIVATASEYKGTKNEQGDAYDSYNPMPSGRWYEQAQAFANTAIGKTAAEVADLTTDKDALTEVGCSIYVGGYKTALVKAVGAAR